MVELEFRDKTKALIDSLKNICAHYGLGNDGNEFKIITQTFLYKFLNDKFAYEAKKIDEKVANAGKWEEALVAMSEGELEMLQLQMGGDTARLKPHHFISYLFGQQNGSMPFCVELDNLKDTDAHIHQPAAMLVAAD